MVCDPEKLLNIRNNILVLIHAKYCPKDPSECNQVNKIHRHREFLIGWGWMLDYDWLKYSVPLHRIQGTSRTHEKLSWSRWNLHRQILRSITTIYQVPSQNKSYITSLSLRNNDLIVFYVITYDVKIYDVTINSI